MTQPVVLCPRAMNGACMFREQGWAQESRDVRAEGLKMRATYGSLAARCNKGPAARQRRLAPFPADAYAWFALGFALIAVGLACA